MPPVVIVFVFPVDDDDACLGQGPEDVDVEAFVADLAVERFDVAVAPRLTWWNERRPDALPGPVGHRRTGHFWAVVSPDDGRGTALAGEAVEFVDEFVAGDGTFDQPAKAFAGVLELEVDRPHLVRRVGVCGVRRGRAAAQPFAAAALRHAEAFCAPQPLDLLVVDVGPAIGASIVIGAAESPPRTGFA